MCLEAWAKTGTQSNKRRSAESQGMVGKRKIPLSQSVPILSMRSILLLYPQEGILVLFKFHINFGIRGFDHELFGCRFVKLTGQLTGSVCCIRDNVVVADVPMYRTSYRGIGGLQSDELPSNLGHLDRTIFTEC